MPDILIGVGPEQEITYRAIGVIRSPFRAPKGTPIQPAAARGAEGKVIVFSEYVPGLHGLDGFSHVILIYHFHLSGEAKLRVRPYMDDREHGVFATRAPARPNPIGLSVVRLLKIEENVLHMADVDIVDGSEFCLYIPGFSAGRSDESYQGIWHLRTLESWQSLPLSNPSLVHELKERFVRKGGGVAGCGTGLYGGAGATPPPVREEGLVPRQLSRRHSALQNRTFYPLL